MSIATFKDLVALTYTFDVETPDETPLSFEMRAPTQTEVWAIDLDMRPRPEPPVTGFKGSVAEGNLEPVADPKDPGYRRALSEWLREHQMRLILLCWTADIPGDTTEEKMQAMNDLPNWTVSALSRCATLVVSAGQVNIAGRPFRSD